LNERFEQYINGKWENLHSNFTLRLKKILWEARSTPILVLSVHFLSPPKPAGLDPPNYRRRTLYYMRKSLGIFFFDLWKKSWKFFLKIFFWNFFLEFFWEIIFKIFLRIFLLDLFRRNAERSEAFGEYL
jgi:hypothetical protein